MTRTTFAALAALLPALAGAEAKQPSFEVFGFAQVDWIQDFGRVDPEWNAMLRASKVPTVDGAFGEDGEAILSARQSRLGVKGTFPSGKHDLKARIEFDFFGRDGGGSPDSAGQSDIRLRRAYGEWGPFLGGLADSLFMDDDYWPNVVEYWGPSGMVFFRNVQLRYTATLPGPHSLAVAIERPGADIQGYPEAAPDLVAQNELPDFTARYRLSQKWGYVQLSGIVRRLGWENGANTGTVTGWGLNASSIVKIIPGKVHLLPAVVYGEGISNYMNDATPDVGAGGTLADPKGEAVPLLGVSAYLDVYWSPLASSSFGYSFVDLDCTNLQPATALQKGEYASANLLFHPAPNFLVGPEVQWARRTDNDGADGDDVRVQVSAKWSFSTTKDFWK